MAEFSTAIHGCKTVLRGKKSSVSISGVDDVGKVNFI